MSDQTPRGHYQAGAFCTNCGYEEHLTVAVGSYVYEQPCPLCACLTLKPLALRESSR